MRAIFAAFARHSVFANVLLAMVMLAGLIATTQLVREPFPEFSLDIINIRVIWPGGDPEEVEEGISRKIEEALEGIEGIKQYNTISDEGYASATIEVIEGYSLPLVKERVRNAVDSISNFPEDAEEPTIEELTLREEVMMVALTGEGMDERLLKEWSENLKEEIRSLPNISQVKVFGARDYEIGIELSEERLREYNLSFEQVVAAVSTSSLDLSGGTLRTEGEEIRLRTIGRKYTGGELAEIVVLAQPNGDLVTLDRVATIRDDFVEDRVISRFNGKPAAILAVLKTPDEDALAIAGAVKEYVAEKQEELPQGLNLSIWGDFSLLLQARIDLLVNNGLIGLVLVFLLLWMFLDLRLSFWAGMGMPISIAGALFVMWMVGATLNMISLFGLIMVLGIIVDDAIIVGEAIYVARKNGAPPMKAAVDGVNEVGLPVLAAVMTTIVAFMPLMFVSGVMGKFISILPVVVVACLSISLVECLIILPAHLNHLPEPARKKSSNPLVRLGGRVHGFTNGGLEWFVSHMYEPFMRHVLHLRYVTFAVSIAILLVVFGFMAGGVLKFVVFPNVDSDIVTATIEFPSGTPVEVTHEAVIKLEEALHAVAERTKTISGDPLLKDVYALTGQTISDNTPIPRRGNHLGSVRAELLANEQRGVYSEDLMAEWEQEFGAWPGVEALSFAGLAAGPPGAPIEIWVQGHDQDQIGGASDALKEKLATYDGVFQIQHDFRPGKTELRFELKPEARTMGLTVADLGRQVFAGYFGAEAVRQQRGRDDVRVRVRYSEDERSQVSELANVRIRTPQGNEVPLYSVANVTYGPGYTDIKRTDGLRRATVTAEVHESKANANEIFADLNAGYFQQLERKYPGIRISQQGEKKKMTESIGSLFISFPLALLGMFIIIATIFRSYIQPLIILITVPYGIIGAVIGHIVLGYDLSMMSIFGMVALSGVVVNDAIVLIERVNENLAEGMTFFDAVRKGGARRFRAIILTSVSTVGGLMPLIAEDDLQAQFLIPMAVSIAGGVAFATLLTLILIPCLLVIVNDLRRLLRLAFTGTWPTREEVEPATTRHMDPDEVNAHGREGESVPDAV